MSKIIHKIEEAFHHHHHHKDEDEDEDDKAEESVEHKPEHVSHSEQLKELMHKIKKKIGGGHGKKRRSKGHYKEGEEYKEGKEEEEEEESQSESESGSEEEEEEEEGEGGGEFEFEF
ncbi:UNVERIFIED_CONTAM: hypothetical protein Sindi_2212500 [Sesamum indicum]